MSKTENPQEASVLFDGVTVALDGVTIFDAISATVPKGESTAIIGPNGAGKTTLLLALLGQIPYSGDIRIAPCPQNKPLRIGYVPQRLNFDRGMPLTAMEFMVIGMQRQPLWLGIRKKHRERSLQLLAAVQSDGLADRRLGALSGGELQRVLLALAIAQEPHLLVLDEPAAGVDPHGAHVFCEILETLRQELGFTQLMVSHDLPMVSHHASHVICMNRRIVAQGPPREVLTNETLTAIFGLHMGLVDSRALPSGQKECTGPCCAENHHHA